MELIKIDGVKSYLSFIRELYADDPHFKDNKTDIIKLICNPKGAFYGNSEQEMLEVLQDGKRQCQAVLIHHKNLPDTLMVALFEAREHAHDAVDYLLSYSKEKAHQLGCTRVASLNGHCNYSIGFLSDGFQIPPRFGQAYNPSYYPAYFADCGFREHRYASYSDSLATVDAKLAKFKQYTDRSEISFSHRNLAAGNFRESMRWYTTLCNEIFHGHAYYFKREDEEDRELFSAMRPLLNEGNLIFAMKNQIPVGFILWYPDYNELVPRSGKVGYSTFFKCKLLGQRPRTVIVTEIGVYPEYEGSGLILSLFHELNRIARTRYGASIHVASSWVYNGNERSRNLVSFLLGQKNKEFTSYEADV